MGFPVLSSAVQIRFEINRELVQVPEWRASVWVQELTGAEMDAYRKPMYKIDGTEISLDMTENTLRLLCYALRDEAGNRLFPNVEKGIKELGTKGSGAIERLARVARKLNRMGSDADELEGNSDAETTDDSSSDSPVILAAQ